MKNRYEEIMEHIEVTEEMRERILQTLEAPEQRAVRQNRTWFRRYRQYLAAAACLLLVLSVWAAPHLLQAGRFGGDVTMAVPQIKEVSSVQKLSKAVGFPVSEVTELTGLPFSVEETAYTAYCGELAEITYTGDGQTATYRKSVGDTDNSGDYNDYALQTEAVFDGVPVLLKGDKDLYPLAVWFRDGYAYSLSLSQGLSVDGWSDLTELFQHG